MYVRLIISQNDDDDDINWLPCDFFIIGRWNREEKKKPVRMELNFLHLRERINLPFVGY